MTNQGNPDNLIVNAKWILKQGTDRYILKNKLTLDIARGRFRDAIEIGPVNTFGAGDHSVPIEFEADISKTVNWVNLNARDENGFLTNLPYTLQMTSNDFDGEGSSATGTAIVVDGEIEKINVSNQGTKYSSVLITLSGGSPDKEAKAVGIVSEGKVIKIIVIDKGSGFNSAPTVTITEVSSPLAFAFNAELGDVSVEPAGVENRIKIIGTLIITDDAVHPVDPTE